MLQFWKRAHTGRVKTLAISLGLVHVLTLSWAATFTVNSTADGADASPGNGVCATAAGVCTLRAAVQEANALAGADTINFSLPTGSTITLTSAAGGAISITSDLVIRGPAGTSPAAQLRVSGGWDGVINSSVGSRVFFMPAAAGRSVTVSDLTVINGNAGTQTGGADPGSWKSNGGAIYVEGGTLDLERMTFSNSTSNDGGALEVENATVNISDSTFHANKARDDGGAIDIGKAPAAVNVVNTTFANNRSEAGTPNGVGGTGGAVRVDGKLTLTYVTMAHNVGGRGGAIDFASTGLVTLRSSLIFNNTELDGTVRNCVADAKTNRAVESARTDGGNNWTNTDNSCALGNTITATSLALAPALGSNGGPTQTLSLASSSGVNGVVPASSNCGAGVGAKDQRGVARAVNGGCEPGAFELQDGPPNLTLSKSHTGAFIRGGTGTYTLRVTNVGTSAATGTVTLSDTLPAGLSYKAASGSGWTVSANGSTVTATRADTLAANASFPDLVLSVNVLPSAPDTLTNSATVSGGGDTTPGNNTATDPTTTVAAGSLTLDKAVRNVTQMGSFGKSGVGAPGDVLEYHITFTAQDNLLYNVVIRDAVPTSTRLVQNSYGATGEVQLTCPGGSVTTVDLNGVTSGTLDLAVTQPGPCGNSLAPGAFGYLRFQVLIQ